MRHRDHRDVHTGEAADLAREDATRVDDDLGLDLAPVGDDAGDPAALDRDRRDTRVGVDLGAAPPSALRQRESQLARVDIAVRREVRRAENPVGRHRRRTLPEGDVD